MRNKGREPKRSVAELELDRKDSPVDAAWRKYKAAQHKATGGACKDTEREVFGCGWNAALNWIPFRIAQALRKEIEELKEKISNA